MKFSKGSDDEWENIYENNQNIFPIQDNYSHCMERAYEETGSLLQCKKVAQSQWNYHLIFQKKYVI